MDVNRGEIWLVNLSATGRKELFLPKPALIISDDMFNRSLAEMVIILPLTFNRKGIPTHVELQAEFLQQTGYVKCEDIRPLSTKKLIRRLGQVDNKVMKLVEERIKLLLSLS